jgi:hypothetical protein
VAPIDLRKTGPRLQVTRNDKSQLLVKWTPQITIGARLTEPAVPQAHLDSVNETEPLDRNAVITPITQQDSTRSTTYYLGQRLWRVLFDLDLDRKLNGWITPVPDGMEFADLSIRQVDALVLALEDVVAGRRTSYPTPGPNQLTLDLGDL